MTYHGNLWGDDEDDGDEEQQDAPRSVTDLSSEDRQQFSSLDEYAPGTSDEEVENGGWTPIDDFKERNFGGDGVDPYDFVMADEETFESEQVEDELSGGAIDKATAPLTAINEAANLTLDNSQLSVQEASQQYIGAAYEQDISEEGQQAGAEEFQEDAEANLERSMWAFEGAARVAESAGGDRTPTAIRGAGNMVTAMVAEPAGLVTGVNIAPETAEESTFLDENEGDDVTDYNPPAHYVLLDALTVGGVGGVLSKLGRSGVDEAATAARGSDAVEGFNRADGEAATQAGTTMATSGLARFGLRSLDDLPADRIARMDFDEFMGASRSVDQSVSDARIPDAGIEDLDVSRAFDEIGDAGDNLPVRSVEDAARTGDGGVDEVSGIGARFSDFTDRIGFTSRGGDGAFRSGRWARGSDEAGEAAEAAARSDGLAARTFDDISESVRFPSRSEAAVGALAGGAVLADRTNPGETVAGWVDSVFDGPGPGTGGGGGGGASADALVGTLSAQTTAQAGNGFDIQYSLTNTRGKGVRAAVAVTIAKASDARESGMRTRPDGTTTDSEKREAVVSEQRMTLEGDSSELVEIPKSKTRRLPPGDYTLSLIALTGESDKSRLSQQSISVVQPDDEEDQNGNTRWSEPEVVSQLAAGWYLMRQVKVGSEEQRFLVVGQREDGTHIYIGSGGRVSTSATTFDTEAKAREAHAAWMEQTLSGEGDPDPRKTPAPGGARPNSRQVMDDASGGFVGTLKGAATSRPLIMLAIIGVSLWYISDGKPLKYVKGLADDAVDTVEEVMPGR